MQIVIPMSGHGERFRRAGYTIPKPLIEMDGKPVIAHVLDLFPGEIDIVFVCNQNDLNDPLYRMRSILRELCPTGRIIGIPPHRFGPVYAIRQAEHLLNPLRPVVVNYCDFSCYWDWHHFKQFVKETACTGAIPAYKGFHPHSLRNTNYAYMRQIDGWVRDIQKKKPYTRDPMEEFASSGTYHFATAQIMSDAFRVVMERNLNVGGEYYVSLAYKPLIKRNEPVAVYPLQHFIQWGTPEDVAEYKGWSKAFLRLVEKPSINAKPSGSLILPMGGVGQRFVSEGYRATKPMIPVSGRPMVVQAARALPPAEYHVFVLRADMPGSRAISKELRRLYPDSIIKTIPHITEGQACTALIGLDALEQALGKAPGPITFGACDHGALYDVAAFQRLADDRDVDVIVWGVRGHANAARHPHMFGWIKTDNERIDTISVKTPLASPDSDPIVCGTFTFRRADDFRRSVERLIERNGRVNGEFHIDSCVNDAIALGLNCQMFEVNSYICWGTPNDLRTFEYWQSCFHKWPGHPYRLRNDHRIPAEALEKLIEMYRTIIPEPVVRAAR